MLLLEGVVALPELRGEYVAHPEAVASGLVHIGRTYALERGADF